jgi:rhodanese-related sulfurtransferase
LLLCAASLPAEGSPSAPPLTNSLGILLQFHDFGTVGATQSFSHEFTWHNASTNPLVVRSVTTSCDCLQVTAFPQVITPGGTDKLTVTAHPKTPGPTDWVAFAHVEGSDEARLFWLSGNIGATPLNAFPQELLVAATNLLRNPAGLAGFSFVDVRSPDQFRLGHIPGSLNLPLFTVKARGFLRPKRLVLLNEGHNSTDLLQEALRLKQLQFASVTVLDGGFRAWQLAGGTLEGEAVNSPALATLEASQFHAVRNDPGWLVIAVRTNPGSAISAPLPIAGTIPFEPGRFPADLAALGQQKPDARRLLLVTAAGEDQTALETATREFRSLPVFYLAGGAAGYAQYFGQQLAMQNRRLMTLSSQDQTSARFCSASRPAGRSGGCGGCGGK